MGEGNGTTVVNLELRFPNLNGTGYEVTSPAQRGYNCIAWAAGDDSREPDSFGQYYWPEDLPREYTVATPKPSASLDLKYTMMRPSRWETKRWQYLLT